MEFILNSLNNLLIKRIYGKEVDRISNLPLDLTHKILEYLPIQEAVKTSVLSKHWMFQWASIPHLILDESFCKIIERRIIYESADFSSIYYSNAVDNIILNHVGPISKFVLYVPDWFQGETHMWIRRVCANDVKEFTLEFAPGLQQNLPSCLFSCSSLTHLTLTGYNLLYHPPAFKGWTDLTLFRYKFLDLSPTFKGFPHLIYLKLYSGMRIEAKVLETLISWCPQLESLHLMIRNEHANLKIQSPKLKTLFVKGYINRLHLEETMTINTLGLDANIHSGLNEIHNCIVNVENLVLKYEFWWASDYSRTISVTMRRLQTLKLEGIRLYNQSHISFILRLFENSPKLEQLHIEVSEAVTGAIIVDHSIPIERSYNLRQLKKVQLCGISGHSVHQQLLQYILAHSPVLEEMSIEFSSKMGLEEKNNLALMVMGYRRASTNASIIIKPS